MPPSSPCLALPLLSPDPPHALHACPGFPSFYHHAASVTSCPHTSATRLSCTSSSRFRILFSFRVILYASCLPSFFLPLAVSACSCASLCLCSSPAVSYYYYCALYPIACPVRNVYVAAWTCSLFVCLLLFSRFFFFLFLTVCARVALRVFFSVVLFYTFAM